MVQQSLRGVAAATARPPEDADDEDPMFIEKHQTFNLIQKYAADEQKYTAAGDLAKAHHARQMKESFEADFNKLEEENPTPLWAEKKEEFKAGYLADVEKYVGDKERFSQLKRQAGEDKIYNDTRQRLNGIYDMLPDHPELHFIRGDSRDGRHPDWHIARIKLPPEVKKNLLHHAKLNQGRANAKTIEDRLVELGYIERLTVEYDENTKLEDKDPEHMTQEEYEEWRRKQGANPKYHRMF
jgi:hypothetical protein